MLCLSGVGRKPYNPLNKAGILIDPPKSVHIANGEAPHDTRAASPPEDPPVVLF